MATIEEILAGTDARGFDEGSGTFLNTYGSGRFDPNNLSNLRSDGILGTKQAQNIISATPIFASEDIAARNVGVPQDNRLTGILRNTVARPLLFQAGANVGLTGGKILTGAASLPFALAGGIASQFLPLDRSKPDMDYQYVNDPNNMGGLRVVDN